MPKSYEFTLHAKSGDVVFWAKAGSYLWVDHGNGGAQACEGGHVGRGQSVSIGGQYSDLTNSDFEAICRRWYRARRSRLNNEKNAWHGSSEEHHTPNGYSGRRFDRK